MTAPGALVLVVGPSGAGKDSLIAGARSELAHDPRFVFPRRVVTRSAMAELEDHDSISPHDFALHLQRGAYALDWEAHGLSYGVPSSIDAAIVAGRVVVANVSRRVIAAAMDKYRRCAVLVVTADPLIRASRLEARGREGARDIAARLAHDGTPVPQAAHCVVIDNSGPLAAGIAAFVAALTAIAAA